MNGEGSEDPSIFLSLPFGKRRPVSSVAASGEDKTMTIAVTAMGTQLTDPVSPRFGRCPYFLIIETEDMTVVDAVENQNVAAGGGAGIQSAQMMADRDVEAVLTGNCGPKAFEVLGAAGIEVYAGVSGTVQQAVEAFKAGNLGKAGEASVGSHHGMGASPEPKQP